MNEIEIWKEYTGEITAFHGHLMISNKGRILRQYDRWPYASMIKGSIDMDGYNIFRISINGKRYTKKVHRLVAETFCPNPENKPEVDHINAIRNDNRVENLRWATRLENSRNPHHRKLKSKTQKRVLSQYNHLIDANKKPVYAEHIDGSSIEFDSVNQLMEYFDIKSYNNIFKKLKSGEYYTAHNSKMLGWKIGYIKNP